MRLFIFSSILTLFTGQTMANQHPAANTDSAQNQEPYQSIDAIHKSVLQHVKQKLGQKLFEPTIDIRRLSPELKLRNCQSNLQIQDNNLDDYAGRMTISVHCLEPKWRVFVPVNVDGKLPVVKTTKGIIKKAVIEADELTIDYIPYRHVPNGAMIDIEKAVGMRAKRSIGANGILKIRDLQPPYWVFKGHGVNIVTRISGIEVTTRGTALKNAVEGQQVDVENNSSKKIVKGIVIAPSTVLVP